MKWFKHHSDSMDSNSLAEIRRKFGWEGIGRYWALIEYLSLKWDVTQDPIFDVQRETIRGLLGFRSWNSQRSFLDHSATIQGIEVEHIGNVHRIKADILTKLLHSDFKKSGKRKEKLPPQIESETKSETKIENSNTPKPPRVLIDPNHIVECYNFTCGQTLPLCQKLSDARKKKIQALTKKLFGTIELWQGYWDQVMRSPFLTEQWQPGFDWLLNETNAIKVMEGNYLKGRKQESRTIQNAKMENPYAK